MTSTKEIKKNWEKAKKAAHYVSRGKKTESRGPNTKNPTQRAAGVEKYIKRRKFQNQRVGGRLVTLV